MVQRLSVLPHFFLILARNNLARLLVLVLIDLPCVIAAIVTILRYPIGLIRFRHTCASGFLKGLEDQR